MMFFKIKSFFLFCVFRLIVNIYNSMYFCVQNREKRAESLEQCLNQWRRIMKPVRWGVISQIPVLTRC